MGSYFSTFTNFLPSLPDFSGLSLPNLPKEGYTSYLNPMAYSYFDTDTDDEPETNQTSLISYLIPENTFLQFKPTIVPENDNNNEFTPYLVINELGKYSFRSSIDELFFDQGLKERLDHYDGFFMPFYAQSVCNFNSRINYFACALAKRSMIKNKLTDTKTSSYATDWTSNERKYGNLVIIKYDSSNNLENFNQDDIDAINKMIDEE